MSARSSNLGYGDTDDVVGTARSHAVDRGNTFFHRVVDTDATLAGAIARLTLGLVMLPHALQKAFGWFGGNGFTGTFNAFVAQGIPGPIAVFVIFGEIFGALALVLGALTRIGAVVIAAIMLGAIALVHLPNGLFMNWSGTQRGEGFEYHLLAIGLALVSLLLGGGKASVDRGLMKWRPAEGGGVSPALAETAP